LRFADFVQINPNVALEHNLSHPCVMMEDIKPGYRYVISPKAKEFKGGSVFESGDILFARITPCLENGKIAQYVGEPAFGSTEFIVFRGKPGISDNNFIFYLALTDTIRKPAEKSMFGASGRQRADINVISEIDIPFIPFPIQQKIASILSDYDNLIENNIRRICNLEEMAQVIYREWFVHFRFPGYEGVRMVESPLGLIPEGWTYKNLCDIAQMNPEQIKKENQPDIIHYIDISSVSTGRIYNVTEIDSAVAPSRARRRVKDGDIIWSSVRPNRKSYALLVDPQPNTIVSTGFAVIRPIHVPYSYLYLAVSTDQFVGYLANHATGAAYPAVNQVDFERAIILVPNNEIVSVFHQAVSNSFLLIQNLSIKNDNLRRQRDLLLPRLVSRELNIESNEIES
jgi:type I restriction enzyme S subunit